MAGKQTVLVVDDRGVDRLLLRKLLESCGYMVLEAADGEEGLEMARFYEPDLIITDTLMPRLDGFGLLKNIKTDEKTNKIPCIIYSAVYNGCVDEKLALLLGASDFIPKPLDAGEFLKRVGAAIGANDEMATAMAGLAPDEEEYLRRYSHVVAAKLEEKVSELEATNERLRLIVADGLRAEDALRIERDNLTSILESMADGVYIVGQQYDVQYVNSVLKKDFGSLVIRVASTFSPFRRIRLW